MDKQPNTMDKIVSFFKSAKLLAFLALAVIVGVLSLFLHLNSYLTAPLKTSAPWQLTVSQGDTLNSVCRRLTKQDKLSQCHSLKIYHKLNSAISNIQTGHYQFENNVNLKQVLTKLNRGDITQFSFTVIEGDNLYQVIDKVKNSEYLTDDISQLSFTELARELNLGLSSPEGWLYPDTYFYTANSSALTLLSTMVNRQQQALAQLWQQRTPLVTLTSPYQALIMASIIEKETAVESERTTISSVFHNRLNKKMRLQTDPTVIYGVWQEYNGDITSAHLRQKTPYNTYRIGGLPPTPIANPSIASIKAALAPANSDYYYFVASGEGGHVFNKTLKQHNKSLKQYLAKLKEKNE